jgi:hypothetical protein
VLASVFDGDINPIKKIVEDRSLDEYVRSAGLKAITILVANGLMNRDDAIEYFRYLFDGRIEKENDGLWASLVCSCCDIGPVELLEEIEGAFSDDLVDLMTVDMDCVRDACRPGDGLSFYKKSHKSNLVSNIADEMRWWVEPEDEKADVTAMSNVYELVT